MIWNDLKKKTNNLQRKNNAQFLFVRSTNFNCTPSKKIYVEWNWSRKIDKIDGRTNEISPFTMHTFLNPMLSVAKLVNLICCH